jgi:hypothetical protein
MPVSVWPSRSCRSVGLAVRAVGATGYAKGIDAAPEMVEYL